MRLKFSFPNCVCLGICTEKVDQRKYACNDSYGRAFCFMGESSFPHLIALFLKLYFLK